MTKSEAPREALRSAAAAEVDRWEQAITDELLRVFDRQERVVLARLQGTKARKHTRHWDPPGERKIDPKYIVDPARWALDAVGSTRSTLTRLFTTVYGRVAKRLADAGGDAASDDVEERVAAGVDERLRSLALGVETAREEVEAFIQAEEDAGTPMPEIVKGVRELYATRKPAWAARIATLSAVGSINQAGLFAAADAGSSAKQWLSRRDDKVRTTHADADGQVRLLDERFRLGGHDTGKEKSLLMFPGDPAPSVPIGEVINCRCTLLFSPPRKASSKALPKSEKCEYCKAQATQRILHSEGMAYIPVCGAHLEKGKGDAARSTPGGEYDASNIDGVRDIKAVVRRVRTPAGSQAYGQPIGTVIVPDPAPGGGSALAPVFATPPPATSASTPAAGTKRPAKIDGKRTELVRAGDDPVLQKMFASHNPGVPLDDDSMLIVVRDGKGRVGAYIAWSTGGSRQAGEVLAVSVHPALRGRRIGDALTAEAMKIDPDVQPTTRPAPARASSRPPRAATSSRSAPVPTSSRPVPALDPNGNPIVRGRTQPGDQPGTSGDFKADAARIERLQQAYMRDRQDTQTLFARAGRFSRTREKQQQEIIDHFLSKPTAKKDRKLLVLGGLPGAGKTTTLNSAVGQATLGIDLDEYVTVNADEVKAEMIRRGMIPEYPGLTADEAATLYHAESFEVAHSLMRQAAAGGYNFVYDTSLKSSSQLGFATGAGSRSSPPPYDTTVVFVDVPLPVAKQRARDRYLAGDRYMPLALIDGMRSHSGRRSSGPAEEFDRVKGQVNRWFVFDNAGADPVLTGQGGKPASRPARTSGVPARTSAVTPPPAAPAAPAAPTPAPAPVAPVAAPSVATSAIQVPSALPDPPAGARVFAHPQGKHIYLLTDGSLVVYKPDGKRATSSATAAKLLAGYGGWTELGTAGGPSSVAPLAAAIAKTPPASSSTGTSPTVVAAPKAPLQVSAGAPPPSGSLPVAPMDFNEAALSDVPKYIADPDWVFQQKVDGIRGVLVIEPGRAPWFASKKGDRLVSSTAARTTGPMLAKLPATPAGSPAYRVEGEILDGKFHVFDMVVVGQESEPYEVRKAMADAWVQAVSGQLPQVVTLPTAKSTKEKQALWDAVLASGAEGVMMKRKDAGYSGGQRVSHTLKAKITATADVVVLERNRGGKDNAVFGLLKNGKVVEIGTVSTGGKDKALGAIQVGEVLEVEYLWAMASGSLTQPRIVRKRPDKTPADVTDITQLRVVDKTVLALAAKRLRLALEQKVAPERAGIVGMPGEDDRSEVDECTCCGGSGEHRDGHECYVCDASGLASEQAGEVCEGHHGRPDDGPDNAEARYGAGFVHKGASV